MHVTDVEPGTLGPCPVAPDALQGIKHQQTNPARWNGPSWEEFCGAVRARGIDVLETTAAQFTRRNSVCERAPNRTQCTSS